MTHTSLVPTTLTAGYRHNVIPSEAKPSSCASSTTS